MTKKYKMNAEMVEKELNNAKIKETIRFQLVKQLINEYTPEKFEKYCAMNQLVDGNICNRDNQVVVAHICDIILKSDIPAEIDLTTICNSNIFSTFANPKLEEKILTITPIEADSDYHNSPLYKLLRVIDLEKQLKNDQENQLSPLTLSSEQILYLLNIDKYKDFELIISLMQIPIIRNHQTFLENVVQLKSEHKAEITHYISQENTKNLLSNIMEYYHFEKMADNQISSEMLLLLFGNLLKIDLNYEIREMSQLTLNPLITKTILNFSAIYKTETQKQKIQQKRI
ncbi:MAG: hypothetical protein PUB18_02725 [bacterium]|nr:hypothetical protein [bacterium]